MDLICIHTSAIEVAIDDNDEATKEACTSVF
jgi:hypothetical protein